MSPFSKNEYVTAAILFLAVAIFVFSSRTYRLYNTSAVSTTQTVVLFLDERTNLEQLADKLEELPVRLDKREMIWAGRLLGWRFFRPGRYELDNRYSYTMFLSDLARGIQTPGNVTVLPGTDVGRLSRHIARQVQADSASIAAQFNDSSSVAIQLGFTGEELFSRMLPNTYQMYWTSSPQNIVRRIYREFQSNIENRLTGLIAQSEFDIDEIVILASIVEWEARHAEEKPIISGLYINRLNRNMRLQADPTVLYALGERRRVLFEDYRIDHPYNTYIIRGLPPGPITNPDEASIRAVLEPEEHNFLYMVAAPGGRHVFSRTFEEHRRASAEWRSWIREQYRIQREREREEQN